MIKDDIEKIVELFPEIIENQATIPITANIVI